jgi:aryl-phospho-beta-D-glucosidase BglC (GH1 family)
MASGCVDGDPPTKQPLPLTRLEVDRTYLRDDHGRYVFFHGVNASCTTKVPVKIDKTTKLPTYIGRPFPLEKARAELTRLRDMGFDSIRLLVMWEGVEPERKGKYDQAYLSYLREIVKIAGELGIYVLMDMHQDMFSRHLLAKFNSRPEYGEPGSVEHTLLSLAPSLKYGYDEAVQGDGAPLWAVKACLQEKKFDSKYWGVPRILSGLDAAEVDKIYKLFLRLTGQEDTGEAPPDWAVYFALALPGKFDVDESTDMLPFTNWGLAHTLSVDVARCYACLLAGDKAFPGLTVGKQDVKDHLQEAYAGAWAKVAEQVADLPNVMGYDLMNEPGGNFITLAAVAAMIKSGAAEGARSLLESLLGQEDGGELYDALLTLKILPPDTKPETLRRWGLDKLDVFAVLAMNNGFDDDHLRPFYERVGKAILKADPDALIFIENSANMALLTGGYGGLGGIWEVPMTHPRGPELAGRVVFAPHYYPDIYPFLGFNVNPRPLTAEQVRYRDYAPKIDETAALARYSLGNIPVVFGEFGSYFNFQNTVEQGKYVNRARAEGYLTTAHILDNYYEGFESLFQSRIQWCVSTENDERRGDLWNREDFSVLGPDRKPRAELAWSRPHARALAGKPVSTHYYSDLHYFDPDKGVPVPKREFEVRYASKETEAPSEIVVPAHLYPDGFYVWISDGVCHYDPRTATLYHHPSSDEPGVEHWLRIRPPLPAKENTGWSYFFKGDSMVGGAR